MKLPCKTCLISSMCLSKNRIHCSILYTWLKENNNRQATQLIMQFFDKLNYMLHMSMTDNEIIIVKIFRMIQNANTM